MASRLGSLLCLLLATTISHTYMEIATSPDSQDVVYIERQGLMEIMEVIRREEMPMSPADLPKFDLSRRASNATAKAPFSNQTEPLDLAKISSAVSVAAAAGRTVTPSAARNAVSSVTASNSVKSSASSSIARQNSTAVRATSAVRPATTLKTNGTASALRSIAVSNSTTTSRTQVPTAAIVIGNTTTLTLATSIVKPLATGHAPFLNATASASSLRNATRQQSGNVRAGAPQDSPATIRPVSTSSSRSANLTALTASAVRQPVFPGLEDPTPLIQTQSSTTTTRRTRTVTRTPSPFTRTIVSDVTVDFTKTVVVQQTVAVAPVALSHLSALGLSAPPSSKSTLSVKSTPSVLRIGDHGPASAGSSAATSSSKLIAVPVGSPVVPLPVIIAPSSQAVSQRPVAPAVQSASPLSPLLVPAAQPAASNLRTASSAAPPLVAAAPPASVAAPLTIRTSSMGEKPKATITIAAGNGGNSLVAEPSPAPAPPMQAAGSCNCACKCPAGMFQLQSVINNAGAMASKPSQAPAAPKPDMSTLLTSAIRSNAIAAAASIKVSLSSLLSSSAITTEIKQSMTPTSVTTTTKPSSNLLPSSGVKASLVSLSSVIKISSLSMPTSIARLASDSTDDVVSTVFAASLTNAVQSTSISSVPKLTVGGSVIPLASAVSEPLIVNGHLINLPDQEGLQN